MFLLYSFLYTVSFIIMSPIFFFKRKKYLAGFRQRFGYIPKLIPDGRPVVWIHCVSVGETNAARPLIDKILEDYPDHRLVVSTTTSTGYNLAQDIFKKQAETVFYFPFDWRFSVRRALRRIDPSVILVMETELWFNFLRESYKNGAHIAIVNGRLTEKSVKRYFWIQRTMKRVLHYVELALMQDHESANRLIQLGILSTKVKVTGSLKFDQEAKPSASRIGKQFQKRFGISEKAPLIVAASTHSPEEEMILEAFKEIWKNSADTLPRLLIAPRHPERFGEVENLIKKTGFDWARRSEVASNRDKVAEIILLDSIGELREVFPLAEIVFVGGSLIPHGGQSPLEPAACGKTIVTGYYMMNFEEITKAFVDAEAIVQLPELDQDEAVKKLVEVFGELLKDSERRNRLSENSLKLMKKNRGAVDKIIDHLRPYLNLKKPINPPKNLIK